MPTRAKVAALKVKPETILEDVERLCELADMSGAMSKTATTILKDNISWHYPFPAANTTPWQMEGTILALKRAGFADISCVQNKTVVTNAFKGEDLNHYVPLFRKYRIPVLYNFKEEDMRWVDYKPKAKMHVLDHIFPDGIKIPDYFFGKNIVHLPTVKCVAGDTEVVLADGSLRRIGDIVKDQLASADCVQLERDGTSHAAAQVEILAKAEDGSVRAFTATRVARSSRNGRRVLRLKTRSGRGVTATADHLIHTPGGWTALGELVPGARVALARHLHVEGLAQQLPQTHAAPAQATVVALPGRKYDVAFAQQVLDEYELGRSVPAIAAQAGVRWQSVQALLRRHDVPMRRNVVRMQVPRATSPSFWRWIGYVMAEGCVERGASTDKLWWRNETPAIRDDFAQLTRDLFALEARDHSNGKGFYVYGKALGAFLEEIGLPVPLNAGNKRLPPCLFQCPDDEIAAFLSAYLDGDGSVASKQADVSATTKSERLAKELVTLFARLGFVAMVRPVERLVVGRWTEPRTYYLVTVSGAQVARLAEHIHFQHPNKRRLLAIHCERLAGSKRPSNWDVAPLPGGAVRAVREGLGMTQAATGMPSAVNNIENDHSRPTPPVARRLLDALAAADHKLRFRDDLAALRAIAHEDLAWDIVDQVTDVSEDVDLYDIHVPGAECFVGNGLVLHNCHIYTTTTGAMKNAFGGLLATHRHYTHTWIHRTLVDLLAIQKEIHSGLFAIMDGTTAGNGPGPRTMFPVVKDYMLASSDQVAIDAVAAKMMGFDPMSLEYIRVAHEDGLGVGDPRDIDVVGADVSGESWGFQVGDNGASKVGDFMWFGPMKRFQKIFFHTPLVNAFIFGSEAYHDYYRWPLKDKKTFEGWKRDTSWGRLFEAYERGEAERIVGKSEATATTAARTQ